MNKMLYRMAPMMPRGVNTWMMATMMKRVSWKGTSDRQGHEKRAFRTEILMRRGLSGFAFFARGFARNSTMFLKNNGRAGRAVLIVPPSEWRAAFLPLHLRCCRTSERKGDLARTQVPFVFWRDGS